MVSLRALFYASTLGIAALLLYHTFWVAELGEDFARAAPSAPAVLLAQAGASAQQQQQPPPTTPTHASPPPRPSAVRSIEVGPAGQALAPRRRALYHPKDTSGPCPLSDDVMWDEWRACVEGTKAGRGEGGFGRHVRGLRRAPWLTSNHTAVLLEFRPWRRQIRWSMSNAMNNLPVYWRMQVCVLYHVLCALPCSCCICTGACLHPVGSRGGSPTWVGYMLLGVVA
jgi:hypothetical protein